MEPSQRGRPLTKEEVHQLFLEAREKLQQIIADENWPAYNALHGQNLLKTFFEGGTALLARQQLRGNRTAIVCKLFADFCRDNQLANLPGQKNAAA